MDRIADFIRSIVVKHGSRRLQFDLNRGEIAFGPFAFRPSSRQLLRRGEPVVLNGKALDLLAILLDGGDRVWTREELYERLWGDRVVEDANLSQTVYLLRRALEPDGDGRTFIETIPRLGYRFVRPLVEAPMRTRRTGFAAAAIAVAALALALTPWLLQAHRSAASVAARDAGELGEYHLALRTPEHLSYALAYFKEAERAAPGDALAYANAAAAYALLAEFQAEGSARRQTLISLANASADAALLRDAGLSRAFAVRGFIAYRFDDDRIAAAADLERALAADPGDAEAHLWHGVLLMREGDLLAATDEFATAHRLAPTWEISSRWLARAYAFQGRTELAIALARETLRIEPDDAPAMLTIAQAQEQRGDLRSAIDTLRVLLRTDPYERPFVVPDIARLEVRIGKANRTLAVLRAGELARSGRSDPFEMALLYLTMGRKTAGMHMLRRTDSSTLAIAQYDPRLLALL